MGHAKKLGRLSVPRGGISMTKSERSAIVRWLDHIEEEDFGIVCDVLDKCEADQEALQYFLMRAKEAA